MSLGVEEPGMEEGQPHGKPWGTVVVNRGERWLLGTWRRGMDGRGTWGGVRTAPRKTVGNGGCKPWGTVAVRDLAERDGCWRVMLERRQGKGRCPHGCRPLWSVLDIAGTAVPAG